MHLLESKGIRVYSLAHDNADLHAFCVTWRGQPFVFLSTLESAERGRFDAAHELGHLVLHGEERDPRGPAAEQEANSFAAAFLMPGAGVLGQGLSNATVDRLLVAKKRWSVAAMAMAHRVNELGLMSEWRYRTACADLSRRGYRRGEPEGTARESSQLLTKVLQQLRGQGVGTADIARDRGLESAQVQARLFGLTPRVVAAPAAEATALSEDMRPAAVT